MEKERKGCISGPSHLLKLTISVQPVDCGQRSKEPCIVISGFEGCGSMSCMTVMDYIYTALETSGLTFDLSGTSLAAMGSVVFTFASSPTRGLDTLPNILRNRDGGLVSEESDSGRASGDLGAVR